MTTDALMESRLQKRMERTHSYLAEQDAEAAVTSAKLAHAILDDIIASIKPGMLESEVRKYATQCFAEYGIEEMWHPPYVRFGGHTLLTFMDAAKEDKTLGENDIAFVDIGIVKNGIEGDAGRSIVLGDNPEYQKLAAASYEIFQEAKQFWQTHNPTGTELYKYIYQLADKMGVVWNLDPAGHLIGAFPHRGWKRGINHYPEHIESGKWILEIQIKHSALPIGAFFEDLLYG